MGTAYPGALDTLPTTEANSTAAKDTHPALHNDANAAINAIEKELGIDPKGSSKDVASLLTSIAILGKPAPVPSADKTGTTDTGALSAAMPAAGTLVLQAGGDYYVTKLPTIVPGQGIISAGPGTTVHMVGTGVCLEITNAAFNIAGGEVEFQGNMPNRTGGFTIEGSGAGAGSRGISIGDIYCARVDDLIVKDFTGANSANWEFKSVIGWAERLHVTNCHSINGTTCVLFTNGGAGTGSFDYSHIGVTIQAFNKQDGISMEQGVQFMGCYLRFGGNFFGGTGNTGTVWKFGDDNTAVFFNGSHLDFQFETDGSGTGHKTINMGNTAGGHAYGSIAYINTAGGPTFVAGNVTQPNTNFSFAGYVNIDSNLGKNQPGEGLNVLGGSTWSRGFATVSAGNVSVGVNGGDYFTATLANGSNVLKLNNGYKGRARRILLVLTQPASGAAGTVDWSAPGNEILGNAQSVVWTQGGGAAPTLQVANNAVDVISLVTADGITYYGTVLSTVAPPAQGFSRPIWKPASPGAPTVGLSGVYGAESAAVVPDGAAVGVFPTVIQYTTASVTGSETITVRFTATYSDSTTASVTQAGVTTNTANTVGDANKLTLLKDGVYITKITAAAKTDKGSTTATVALTYGGANVL